MAPIWMAIFLLIFVLGHYFRSYLAFSTLKSGESLATLNPEWESVDWDIVSYGLTVATAALLLFLIFTFVFVRPPKNHTPPYLKTDISIANNEYLIPILFLCSLISLASIALRLHLGIGRMGFETVRLPLQLDTVIFRIQSVLLPITFLFLAFIFHQLNRLAVRNFSITILLIHYVLISMSSLSKSGLAFGIISIAVLFYLMGAITYRMKLLLGIGAIFAVLFYQFGWTIRGAALSGNLGNSSIIDLSIETIKNFINAPLRIVQEIALRITGADGIWHTYSLASPLPNPRILTEIIDRGIVEVFTRDIVGVAWTSDFREPGIVATFILIGGFVGFPFVFLLFLFAIAMLWKQLERTKAAPVLGTYTAISILTLTTSGSLSINELISYFVGIIFYLCLCSLFLFKRIPFGVSKLNGAI